MHLFDGIVTAMSSCVNAATNLAPSPTLFAVPGVARWCGGGGRGRLRDLGMGERGYGNSFAQGLSVAYIEGLVILYKAVAGDPSLLP